jgi:hypothetical protein
VNCPGDSYCCGVDCTSGPAQCVPWGKGPRGDKQATCQQAVVATGWESAVQCAWTGPAAGDPLPEHKQVLSTIVAGPLPGRPGTSLVAVTSNCAESPNPQAPGDDPGCFGALRIFEGATCKLVRTIDDASSRILPTTTPAIGDLDGDGVAEIVAARVGGGVVAYRYNQGVGQFVTFWTGDVTQTLGTPRLDGPALHDLDGDGRPEVILGSEVFDGVNGARLNPGQALGLVSAPHIVNLPPSGVPHLISSTIYSWDVGSKQWVPSNGGSGVNGSQYAAIDLGTATPIGPGLTSLGAALDGVPELITVTSTSLRITTLDGAIISIIAIGSRGAPAIADFDGDGIPEIALPDSGANFVLADTGCVGDPTGCKSQGIRWTSAGQDDGYDTPSSAFDFNGDGRPEVVHGDQCFVRIHDGISGEPLFSAARQSFTYGDYPTMIDLDGDKSGELIVPMNALGGLSCPDTDPADPGLRCQTGADCRSGNCSMGYCRCTNDAQCGGEHRCAAPAVSIPGAGKTCRATRPPKTEPAMTGFRIYRDALDRWAAPRPVWNQHGFVGTDVNDDATIPAKAPTNLATLRATSGQTGPLPAADATVRFSASGACRTNQGATTFFAEACNRGAKPIAAGLSATVYTGAPESQQKLCVAKTSEAIAAGACVPFSCQLTGGIVGQVTIQVNDDGVGGSSVAECAVANNRDYLNIVAPGCPSTL